MRISTSYFAVFFVAVAFRWCCFATVFGGVPIFDENGKLPIHIPFPRNIFPPFLSLECQQNARDLVQLFRSKKPLDTLMRSALKIGLGKKIGWIWLGCFWKVKRPRLESRGGQSLLLGTIIGLTPYKAWYGWWRPRRVELIRIRPSGVQWILYL